MCVFFSSPGAGKCLAPSLFKASGSSNSPECPCHCIKLNVPHQGFLLCLSWPWGQSTSHRTKKKRRSWICKTNLSPLIIVVKCIF